jgi:uncharacterized protein (DUF849 family)
VRGEAGIQAGAGAQLLCVLATTNAELVAHAKGILKSLGGSVATANEARAMLGLA